MTPDPREPATLLIDNSNTRTKFMLDSGGELGGEMRVIPTADITPAAVRELLCGWHFGRAMLCSVVPAAAGALAEGCGVPLDSLGAASPMNIRLDYPGVATLGADRIANAMAAAELCPGRPCVAVDLGTAVTFDAVVPGRECARFIGGVIAPGLASMVQYLSRNTALLPAIEPAAPPRAIGRSTAEALQAGAVFGYRGLVREILRSIEAELGEKPCVIATGGDAALLAAQLPEIDRVEPLLTFHGLRLAAKWAARGRGEDEVFQAREK